MRCLALTLLLLAAAALANDWPCEPWMSNSGPVRAFSPEWFRRIELQTNRNARKMADIRRELIRLQKADDATLWEINLLFLRLLELKSDLLESQNSDSQAGSVFRAESQFKAFLVGEITRTRFSLFKKLLERQAEGLNSDPRVGFELSPASHHVYGLPATLESGKVVSYALIPMAQWAVSFPPNSQWLEMGEDLPATRTDLLGLLVALESELATDPTANELAQSIRKSLGLAPAFPPDPFDREAISSRELVN